MVALFAAYGQGFAAPAATVLFIAVAAMIAAAARFLLKPTQVRSQAIERASGLWTLVLYLTVGAAPLLSRAV
jgi:hypothetical protein